MTGCAKTISHQVYTGRALIAQVSFQRENAPLTACSSKRSGNDHFLYSVWHAAGRGRWWKHHWPGSARHRTSKAMRSDQPKKMYNPIEEWTYPMLNKQATLQEQIQEEFLSREQSLSTEQWFRNLATQTLPIFKGPRKGTHTMAGPSPKPVRIAILDAGIDPYRSLSFRIHIKKGRNFIYGEEPKDFERDEEKGHGTAVAYQVARVCPNAEIYIARVAKYTNEKMVPERQAVVDALVWAREKWDVDIINMSFGWERQGDKDGVEIALDAIGDTRSILMFAPSTNEGARGNMLFPARHRDVIAVDAYDGRGKPIDISGATGSDRRRERFSAPGLNVLSFPGGGRVTGSSYASPIVAGIAGLVLEAFRREDPRPEASVYKRLETREAMELIMKNMLSTQVGESNFLEPWRELREDGDDGLYHFCRRVLTRPLRRYERCGASYLNTPRQVSG